MSISDFGGHISIYTNCFYFIFYLLLQYVPNRRTSVPKQTSTVGRGVVFVFICVCVDPLPLPRPVTVVSIDIVCSFDFAIAIAFAFSVSFPCSFESLYRP